MSCTWELIQVFQTSSYIEHKVILLTYFNWVKQLHIWQHLLMLEPLSVIDSFSVFTHTVSSCAMSLVAYKLLESYTKTTESDTNILSLLCWCCWSVTKWCPTLCNRMDCSMPGSPVLHYLPVFAQIHVHWVGDAIWQTYFLPPPSPFAFSLSQHQCFFQWISFSNQVAKWLELQLQHQSFQWIFRVGFL